MSRILIERAREGMRLSEAVVTGDGLPLLGRGTALSRRHLITLYEEGVAVIHVVDEDVAPWEALPAVDTFLSDLEARFEPVAGARRSEALKAAVRDTFLDFVIELETSGGR